MYFYLLTPPKNKQQFTINIDSWGESSISHIQFNNKNDILLSFIINHTINSIILNSRINNEYIRTPPKYKIDISKLHQIKFNYILDNSKLNINFILNNNEIISKQLKVSNFDFNTICISNVIVSISIYNDKSVLELFLESIKYNTHFHNLITDINNKNTKKEQIVDFLIKYSKQHKFIKQNNLTILRNKEISILMNDIDQNNNDIVLNTKLNSTILINYKDTIEIYKNGALVYNKNKKGYWVYLKNYLFIFINTQLIILFNHNETLQNINTKSIWYFKPEFLAIKNTNILSNKIIILIISCKKNIHKINKLRSLWVNDLKKFGITCLFVIGNNKTEPSQILDDILFLEANDYYEALPEKIYYSFQYINKHFEFDYIYKVDDDLILNPLYLIKTQLVGDYIGIRKDVKLDFNRYWHKNKCYDKQKEKIPYPTNRINLNTYHAKGESGYFISKKAVSLLVKYEKYIISDLYEDKVIGDILWKEGIKLNILPYYKAKLFNIELYNSKTININKFNVLVDVPYDYLDKVYNTFSKINKLKL